MYVGEMSQVGTISEIRRYPVKSMQGELLQRTSLGPLGIVGDRVFGVRDLTTGKILSAKTPKVGTALLSCSARTHSGGSTIVTAAGEDFEAGDARLTSALSSLLDRDVVLERATEADEVYESYWPKIDGLALSDVTTDLQIAMSTGKGTFADLAALHLLSTGSLVHLRTLSPDINVSMDRFRPGISIETLDSQGFIEKNWVNRSATLGGATIAFSVESPRCIMTTLAQKELPADRGVLQAIAQHNRTDFAGFGNFACLGIYAEVVSSGEIAVGDSLSIEQ